LYDKNKTTLVAYPVGKAGAFTIPDGVTSIRYWAFCYCSKLTNVNIPDSVTSIGNGVFYSTNLTSITIPESVTSIVAMAFSNCFGLTSVTFEGTISSDDFDASAFDNDLKIAYLAGGKGTYTRVSGGTEWTKQP